MNTVRDATPPEWVAAIGRRILAVAAAMWVCLLITGIAVLFLWCPLENPPERRLRTVGMVLQVLGVFTVYLGINATRRKFGKPSVGTALADFFIELLARPRHYSMKAEGVAYSIGTGNLSLSGGQPLVTQSVEERVAALQAVVVQLQGEIDKTNQRLAEERGARERADAEEQVQRTNAVNDLRGLLSSTLTGGIEISSFGLLWVILGSILTALPMELSCLFHLA